MSVRKDRLLALADVLEQAKDFDMSKFNHECGTPACIAGWAAWLEAGETPVPNRDVAPRALAFLGVYEFVDASRVSDRLFFALSSPPMIAQAAITREDAIETVRRFAETGCIDWPERVYGAIGIPPADPYTTEVV